MKFLNIVSLISLSALLFTACSKNDDAERVRLFRPVLAGSLMSDSNTIKASWQASRDASSYTLQVSRDTFVTIERTIEVDTNVVDIKELRFNQLYQLRVRANAPDTAYSSRWSNLGAISTKPSILANPGVDDITENGVRVRWTNSGSPVTRIRLIKMSDNSTAADVTLTAADRMNGFRIVSGLSGVTAYTIELYSGTDLRGTTTFTTKSAVTGSVIDLRDIVGVPSILSDTIPDIASGSTVLLKRGETYVISSALSIGRSTVIRSGSDLSNPAQAIISMPANFNITSGSVIDSIVFNDVTIRGTDYTSKYVFNINTACTIGKLRLDGCRAEIFRGLVRTQSQPAIINTFEVNNSILDSISNYGVISIDVATSKADNIILRNSTIYKAEKIITSRNNSSSVLIENCTFNETPSGGGANYYIDYSTSPTNVVTGGITINNSIFGYGKWNNGATNVRGIRASASTAISTSNNHRTSDHVFSANEIPNVTPYSRPVSQLFQDPANGNFKIIDATFPARNTAGDPRWRIQ